MRKEIRETILVILFVYILAAVTKTEHLFFFFLMSGLGKELLFIDPREITQKRMYTEPGGHILIVGATGSGKTSTLFKVMYNLWKAGETIIFRDDANLEFLALVKLLPFKLFIPVDCVLHFDHKNITKVYYDPEKLENLFPQFESDKINVLLFDLFTTSHAVTVKFWTKFFYGSRRGVIQGQIKLSSNIYASMKKFRKMRIRLVGSTHNFNDIHAPLRGQFSYYIFKAMRREHVPERFWSYAHKIENMKTNECIIVDRRGFHQFITRWSEKSRWHIDPKKWVKLKPQTINVPWDGEIIAKTTSPGRRAQQWKTRALIVLKMVIDLMADQEIDFGYRDVAAVFDLSRSHSHTIYDEAMSIPRHAWEERLENAELTTTEYTAVQSAGAPWRRTAGEPPP